MAKRKRDRPEIEAKPTATNVDFPVFVPNETGQTDIEVGRARLRFGTLVVEFKDSAPAVAIQNMIQRGVLLGMGMIMLKPDVVNEMYQDVVENEEAKSAAIKQGLENGLLITDENGELAAAHEDQTVEDILQVLMNLDQIAVEKPVESNSFTVVAEPDELDRILKNTPLNVIESKDDIR